jgi:hypothetical protein
MTKSYTLGRAGLCVLVPTRGGPASGFKDR